MNKFTLLAASLFVSSTVFAEWTKPVAPASTPLAVGDTLYLYNVKADGFLLGANDYETRASVSPTHGFKVCIEEYKTGGVWDGSTYFITDSVEAGGMVGKMGYMFMEGCEKVWVDNTIDGKPNNKYTLTLQADGTYKIGLSKVNPEYNPTFYPETYLGIIPEKKDTRIYLCSPDEFTAEAGYDANGFQISWIFVKPSEYERYVSETVVYEAAVALGTAIEKAKTVAGFDADILSAAEALYANSSATVEAMNAKTNEINEAFVSATLASATATSQVDVLALYGTVEQTFENHETTGWYMNTAATHKQAANSNAAKDASVTGVHLENWNASSFGVGRIYAKLTNIPNGVYRFNTLAFTNVTGGTFAFAGDEKTEVDSKNIDASKEYEVLALVDDNQLEFGLSIEKAGANWVGIDNVNLYYLGAGNDAYQVFVNQKIGTVTDYESEIDEGNIKYYCHNDFDKYLAAKAALVSAQTKADISKAVTQFNNAYGSLSRSIDAYAEFLKLFKQAEGWLTAMDNSSDEANLLADYLQDEAENEDDFNGNNTAMYILTNGTLSTAQIYLERIYFEQLYNDAVASGMKDGDDCTALLKNPRFAEEGGWTSNVGPTWPEGYADETGEVKFPVFQAWNMVCDVYQQLTGLQNGVYEFNINAVFRPGADFNDDNVSVAKAYAYINDSEKAIECADIASADTASARFAKGLYGMKVYGLVTDGTMKVGVTNKVRSVEGCVLWAGDAKLTFRAKNEDVLNMLIDDLLPYSKERLKTAECGSAEIDALSYAIKNINKEDRYDAYIELKRTTEAVDKGVELYSNLYIVLEELSATLASSRENLDARFADEIDVKIGNYYSDFYGGSLANDEVEDAIDEARELIVRIKTALIIDPEDEEQPVDYTSMIINPTFDPEKGDKNTTTIEGWTTTAMNGYKQNTVSYNRAPFELSQKLSGLPAGTYKVKVHTYYRAGYWNEEEAHIANGEETHLTTLYATVGEKTYSTPVLNLTEGASSTVLSVNGNSYTLSDGRFAPDGTTASAEYFAAGAYLNELEFVVSGGETVTIGLSKKDVFPNDYQVVGAWELWKMPAPEIIPEEIQDTTDMSSLIVNNEFDPERGDKVVTYIDGWTTTAMNGYKQNTVSYNRAPFHLYQTISGLPKGTYKVTVNTYYRAGYYNEEEARIANGEDTHLDTLYVQTPEKCYKRLVKNLSEDASTSPETSGNTYTLGNGLYAPDGTTPSVDYFNAGYYLNGLHFYLESGDITIGLRKDVVLPNDYSVVGAWHLYYFGKGNYLDKITKEDGELDAIKATDVEMATPVAYYSLSGTRLAQPQKGVNIVKMSNGMTLKIIVK